MRTDNPIEFQAESGTAHGSLRSVNENKHVALICRGVTGDLVQDVAKGKKQGKPAILTQLVDSLEDIGWSSFRFDYRGRGHSSRAPDVPTVGSMLQDTACAISYIVSTFGKKPDVVIARGYGSRLALECMHQYPTIPLIMWVAIIWLQTSLDIRYRMHEYRRTGVMEFDDTKMEEVFLKSLRDPTDDDIRSWIVAARPHLIVQGIDDEVATMRLLIETRDLMAQAGTKPELFIVRGPHPHPGTDKMVQPQINEIVELLGQLT